MWMARGKEEAEWTRLSHLMAIVRNVVTAAVAGKDYKGISPDDLNPFRQSERGKQRLRESEDSFARGIEEAKREGLLKTNGAASSAQVTVPPSEGKSPDELGAKDSINPTPS